MSKRASKGVRGRKKDYVRLTLSVPKRMWRFFERQRQLPEHAGNRSSYVRSLILAQMNLPEPEQVHFQIPTNPQKRRKAMLRGGWRGVNGRANNKRKKK